MGEKKEKEKPKPDWGDERRKRLEELQRDIEEGREPIPPEPPPPPPPEPEEDEEEGEGEEDGDEGGGDGGGSGGGGAGEVPQVPEKFGPKPIDPGMPDMATLQQYIEARKSNARLRKPLEKIFPNIEKLIEKMNNVERKEFINKISTKAKSVDAQQRLSVVSPFLDLAKEAMLFRGILFNWSEKTLLEQYSDFVEVFFDNIEDRSTAGSAWELIAGSFPDIFNRDVPRMSPGHNPSLDSRQIIAAYNAKGMTSIDEIRADLAQQLNLAAIEGATKENVYDEWGVDTPPNPIQMRFVEEIVIPMLRDYFIDRRILYDAPAAFAEGGWIEDSEVENIQEEYEELLHALYESTKMRDMGWITSILMKISPL